MFAEAEDERLLQKSTIIEVTDQAVPGAVEAGHQLLLEPRVMIPVGIPAGAGQSVLVPEDRDEPSPGLDQPPRRQRGLAEQGHPVGFADWPRLGVENRLPLVASIHVHTARARAKPIRLLCSTQRLTQAVTDGG